MSQSTTTNYCHKKFHSIRMEIYFKVNNNSTQNGINQCNSSEFTIILISAAFDHKTRMKAIALNKLFNGNHKIYLNLLSTQGNLILSSLRENTYSPPTALESFASLMLKLITHPLCHTRHLQLEAKHMTI